MGDVICVYRITPDSVEGFESVKKAVETLKPQRLNTEPVAFGLNAVIATFLVPEKDGALEELENSLNSIENVGSVELENMTRSL